MAKRKNNNRPTPVPDARPQEIHAAPTEVSARYRFYASRMDAKTAEGLRVLSRLDEKQEAITEALRDANSTLKAMRQERDALHTEILEASETIKAVRTALEFLAREEISEILKAELTLQMETVQKALEAQQRIAAQGVIESFDKLSDLLRGVTDKNGRKRSQPTLDEIVMGVVAERSGLLPGIEKLASDDPPKGLGG